MLSTINRYLRYAVGLPIAVVFAFLTYVSTWFVRCLAAVTILALWLAIDSLGEDDDQ